MNELPAADILDTLPHGSMILDDENKITFANRWVLKNLNLKEADIAGKNIKELVSNSDWIMEKLAFAREQRSSLVLSQRLHSYFIPIKLPESHLSGHEFMQQEVVIVPIKKTKGWLHITIRDVTSVVVGDSKLKALYHQLEEGKEKAESEVLRKSAFLAMMSHDIRTPMNGVLGYADLLSTTELTDPQKMYLDVIRSSGNMLLHLVSEILDFSKIEAGKLKIDPELFTIRRAVREVIDIFVPEAKIKSLSLVVDIDESVPVHFFQDKLRFKQIITNLLSNAVKFTTKGYVMIRIRCVNEVDEGQARLNVEIKDTGPGISNEAQENIFKEFVQTGQSTSKAAGTGLGLTICRKLCQLMDGEIELESEEGKGSNFKFHIRCSLNEIIPILSK